MHLRAAAIVLHDVAPPNLAMCKRLAQMVEAIDSDAPITHLLVPEFHRGARLSENHALREWIDRRLEHGDELALHGFYHLDEAAAPRTLGEWIARRVLTASEGEFAALTKYEALERIQKGLRELACCNWHVAGFVPPAWQISAAARSALSELPLNYTSTTHHLWRLPSATAYRVPGLGFSARSAWRRWTSIKYNRLRMQQLQDAPFVRIALHPIDAMYEDTLQAWREIITFVLRDRAAVTKAELLASVERHHAPDSLLNA